VISTLEMKCAVSFQGLISWSKKIGHQNLICWRYSRASIWDNKSFYSSELL